MVAALLGHPVALSLLLIFGTFALYYPVHRHPFINYDDGDYVYENPHVKAGISWQTVKWAFTTSTASNWHPVTWLSHELDCQVFGLKPSGPHDVNVLFHALNAVLLFWVLLWATGFPGRSFMVAAIFALHPINVESVAWIAERKNVLSMMFFVLALGAYRWYAGRPRLGRYALVALLFAVGLMAKPQIITLPCVLLLWDYWPLERIAFRSSPSALRQYSPEEASGERRTANSEQRTFSLSWLVVEKLPLFAIAATSAVITLHVQHGARAYFSRRVRLGNAILSYALYIQKAVWPTRLAVLYPHPGNSLSWREVFAAGFILLAITTLVIAVRRHRYLPVGWFWFLGTLVPMLGLVQVGVQAMADRYAYESLIGLFIIICWGAAELAERVRLPAVVLAGAGLAALLILALIARGQINYWQSDEALWAHALQVTTRNGIAESQLGSALAVEARVEEAVPHFYKALAIDPSNADANMGIAIYLLEKGDFQQAIPYYQRVVADHAAKTSMLVNAWVGMAKAYRALGDQVQMQECLRSARRVGDSARSE
ncbi:MAG TPA: tetratricopeptide repeat protein [Terriglobales bacterium]|nr:tetratricopeptide repeat protein [Terriglobales bacterium]